MNKTMKQQLTLSFIFGFLNLLVPTMAQAVEIDCLQQDSVAAAFELHHGITVAPLSFPFTWNIGYLHQVRENCLIGVSGFIVPPYYYLSYLLTEGFYTKVPGAGIYTEFRYYANNQILKGGYCSFGATLAALSVEFTGLVRQLSDRDPILPTPVYASYLSLDLLLGWTLKTTPNFFFDFGIGVKAVPAGPVQSTVDYFYEFPRLFYYRGQIAPILRVSVGYCW